jgi:hypothetical protein
MVKQLLLPILGVAVFIAAVGIFIQKSGSINFQGALTPSSTTLPSEKSVTIEGKTIALEVANSEPLRARGLSDRSSLSDNNGMLFVFDRQDIQPSFWMKGMLIPLDIVWINNGSIVKIDKNVQPPSSGTSDSDLKTYSPGTPIDYVLEVNAGFSDLNNFKVGSKVTLPVL